MKPWLRNALIVVPVLLLLIVGGPIIYFRWIMDIEVYQGGIAGRVSDKDPRFFEDHLALDRSHSGEGPCFRRVSASDVAPGQVQAAAEEAIALGIADDLGRLRGFFLAWELEYEARAHPDSGFGEGLDQIASFLGFPDNLIILLNRPRLIAIYEQQQDDSRAAQLPGAEAAAKGYSEAKRESVRGYWEKYKQVLCMSGFLQVMKSIHQLKKMKEAAPSASSAGGG